MKNEAKMLQAITAYRKKNINIFLLQLLPLEFHVPHLL